MKIKIEELHGFEAFDTEGVLAFKKGAEALGLEVNANGVFVEIPSQELELDADQLEQLLDYLDQDGVQHSLSMVSPGSWYLDLF